MEATALAWGAAREIERRMRENPIDWMMWLPLQLRYLQSTHRFRLLRAGNQIGKSTVGLADIALAAMGEHPFRPCDVSGEYRVFTATWSQGIVIQGKLHALLPPGRIRPGTEFTTARGYRGKNPAVEVRHRDGSWSIIRFATTAQGALNAAGSTILGALFDEVPPEAVYSEVLKRVQATGGWVSIVMTPINGRVDWIQERCKEGLIQDIHSRLTPDQLVPVGSRWPRVLPDNTVCDQAWIDEITKLTMPHEVDVRIHGGWEIRATGAYFGGVWDAAKMVRKFPRKSPIHLMVGIDHGDRPGKQCAVLLGVDTRGELPTVWVLDEYSDKAGTASPADDAKGILAMLARNGFVWVQLHQVYGDRVHLPGSGQQKSNKDLQAQIAKLLKMAGDEIQPAIRTVKRGAGRGAGSLTIGSRWLYHAMRAGRFFVDPRCEKLIDSIPRYTLAESPWKDILDAVRYGLDPWVFASAGAGGATAEVVF